MKGGVLDWLDEEPYQYRIPGLHGSTGKNNFVNALLLILTGVFAGYTLEPVPSKFREWFSKNPYTKWLTLFMIGLLFTVDFDNQDDYVSAKYLLIIALSATVILILFELLRYYSGETSGNKLSKLLFNQEGRTLLE